MRRAESQWQKLRAKKFEGAIVQDCASSISLGASLASADVVTAHVLTSQHDIHLLTLPETATVRK